MRQSLTLLLLIATFSCHDVPEKNDTYEVFSELDELFSSWDHPDTPGGAVGVFRDGEILFTKGYGMADLEHDVGITPSTVFYIASSGKQFTAFCTLLLEEQGRLSLDDEIQKFLPDFPRYDHPITVRHLLHHLSGIRDYASIWDIQGRSYYEHITAEETYRLIKNQNSIMFKPGDSYLYCNSGYFLLSEIIEKASGLSLKEFARRHIFQPLGMNHTMYLDDNKDLIRNRAFGYQRRADKDFGNLIRQFDLVGSGGVYSSINDLFLWDQNFYRNKLGKGGQEIIDKMYKTGVLNDGTLVERAGGLRNEQYKGLRKISHGGSHGGFKAELMRFPDQNFTVAILSNRSDVNATSLSHKIADMFLEDEFDNTSVISFQSSKKDVVWSVASKEELSRISGHYINLKTGSIRKIVIDGGTPYYWRSETSRDTIVSVGANEFTRVQIRSSKVTLRFDKDENNHPTMTYYSNGQPRFTMHKFDPLDAIPSELKKYEGSYFCPEVNSSYTLNLKNDKLTLAINDNEHSELQMIADNILLNTDLEAVLLFEENPRGEITGFKLNAERVLDLEFAKK